MCNSYKHDHLLSSGTERSRRQMSVKLYRIEYFKPKLMMRLAIVGIFVMGVVLMNLYVETSAKPITKHVLFEC